MLDVGRMLAAAVALAWSIRARTLIGSCTTLVVSYLYALEMMSGLLTPNGAHVSGDYAFSLMLLGPSSLPRSLVRSWPLASLAIHPVAIHVVTAALVCLPWRLLERRSASLSPHSPESYRIDRAAVQFVLLFVLDVTLGAIGVMWTLLSRGG